MMDPEHLAGVIDIGSNSIKLLVARRLPDGSVGEVHRATEEVRIGSGLGANPPVLFPEEMMAALNSIARLRKQAAHYRPGKELIVATSAVRDAVNGPDFAALVRRHLGVDLRILSGQEEADGIGRGIRSDPALRNISSFALMDLGGGSLECLCFEQRQCIFAASFPLGCVRMHKKFFPDPLENVFSPTIEKRLRNLIHQTLHGTRLGDLLPRMGNMVFTGGSATMVRTILAGLRATDDPVEESLLRKEDFEELLDRTRSMNCLERQRALALPPNRADVFPVALAILLECMATGKVESVWHSYYNLRFGIADILLPGKEGREFP